MTSQAPLELHHCDFCGHSQLRIELAALVDGRERCAPCGVTATCSTAMVMASYREARQFLVEAFGLEISERVGLQFCSADEIARYQGARFVGTPGFDYRALGATVAHEDGWAILIESEQPYHMTLATLAHELVHVWQIENLDADRMENGEAAVLVEGLATWVEVELLRRKNLAPEYREGIAVRADIYGQGYRRIVELSRSGGESPFQLVARALGRSAGP